MKPEWVHGEEKSTHNQMLEALERGDHLPVSREDPEWEHNAAVLDDLVHDGFARGPTQDLHDGAINWRTVARMWSVDTLNTSWPRPNGRNPSHTGIRFELMPP